MHIRKRLNDVVAKTPYIGKILTTEIPVRDAVAYVLVAALTHLPGCLGGETTIYKTVEETTVQDDVRSLARTVRDHSLKRTNPNYPFVLYIADNSAIPIRFDFLTVGYWDGSETEAADGRVGRGDYLKIVAKRKGDPNQYVFGDMNANGLVDQDDLFDPSMRQEYRRLVRDVQAELEGR